MSLLAGCQGSFEPQVIYSDARQKLTQGLFGAALQEADQGYRETERNDLPWNWKFKILRAEILLRQGKPQQSVDLLVQEPLPNSGIDILASRRIVQGEALCRVNRPQEAGDALRDAELRIPPARRDLQAELALARGRCALSVNFTDAKHYFMTAAELAHNGDKFIEGTALLNTGFVLLQQQRYVESIDKLNESLTVTASAYANEKALGNLGLCYFELGNLEEASSHSQRAAEVASSTELSEDQMRWLTDLGNQRFAQEDYSKAEQYYLQALSFAQGLPNKAFLPRLLHDLAQLELKRNNPGKASEYNSKAKALDLGDEDQLYAMLTEAEVAVARLSFKDAEEPLKHISLHSGEHVSLRWQAQSDLANVYVAQERFAEADRQFQEAIHTVETARSEVRQEAHRMSILDAWPFYDDYIRFLVDRGNFARALQIAEFSRARTLAEAFGIRAPQTATGLRITQVQSFLRSRNQIILAYWLADKESYLWAITPTKFQLITLPARGKIERAIQLNSGHIDQRRSPEDSAPAQELYEMLVKPAQALIPKNAHVIIAPNRGLYKLNFETLVVPDAAPHYWIEDVHVQNAGSIALLVNSSHRHSQAAKQMLLVGAPVQASSEFPVLQNAPDEMRKVESHLAAGRGLVFSGKDATPHAYRSSDPGQYRLIHFVTHGTANQMSPLDSAIILSADGGNSYKLYAREIKDIPIHAELVTISACESAGKKTYAGEGLVGLAWAFMRAGAHQVVAALWEVDDASTPQLMDDFYGEMGKGKSAVDALHDAKLRMLHSGSLHKPPYYWASLQLYSGS